MVDPISTPGTSIAALLCFRTFRRNYPQTFVHSHDQTVDHLCQPAKDSVYLHTFYLLDPEGDVSTLGTFALFELTRHGSSRETN